MVQEMTSFFFITIACLFILKTSYYFVPVAATLSTVLEGEGLANFSDAPPATISDEIPVNPWEVTTEDFRSPEHPAFNRFRDEISRRMLIEAEGSKSPESPGNNKRRKLAMTIKNSGRMIIKAEGSESPKSPAAAAAYTTASNATYLSGSKVGAPPMFPEVNVSRLSRKLIEANASLSPESPGYKRRRLAMTIKNSGRMLIKAEGSESPESPAAAAYTTASNATYLSGSKVGAPAMFPEVNASRLSRELIEANASVSPESPGY